MTSEGQVTGQNLNDLQNYLVTFNKEIEGEQIPGTIQIGIAPNQTPMEITRDVTQTLLSGTLAQSSPSMTQVKNVGSFYKEQNILEVEGSLGGSDSPLNTGIVTGTDQEDGGAQGQYQTYITGMTEEGSQIISGMEASVLAPEISPAVVQSLINNQNPGNVIRIVSMGADGQMQLVSEELQPGSELPKDLLVGRADGIEQSEVVDGTESITIHASIAANSSTTDSILQALPMSQMHNAQLVALQNSADSSQPQLVAVHAGDSVDETLQVIGAAEGNADNSIILNTCNSFQTVTIVPSEVSKDGEVSYVLIVSQPDGDKDGKVVGGDNMSLFDFKESSQIMAEEVVDEDGNTRRILKVTPKRVFASGTPDQLMCHYCSYTSPKRYLLSRHMKSHSEERPHKCPTCDRGFKTLASLTNHVNTHTGVRPHKCKDCESAFTTSGELVRHIRYRHTFEKPHKCMVCDYASVELSKLKRHMRSHTGERPYQCPHCAYASPDTYKLKRHLRIHTGEKPYECDVCHARFTQSNSLKAHKLIHSGDKPVYQCDLCPTTCGRKTDLKIHIQKLHTSDRPLVCRRCNDSFPDRYSFKLHNKNHDGEKCFKCDVANCEYAALSQRHLDSHMLTHSGEKPFECNECDQAFRQKQLLKRHKNLHHEDGSPLAPMGKIHECSECDQTFTYKGLLTRHLKEHGIECRASEDEGEASTFTPLLPPIKDTLHSNLLNDLRAGKLGNSPQVVIVHPDGRVEEFSSKLDSATKSVDELLMAIDTSEEINMPAEQAGTDEMGPRFHLDEVQKREAGTQVEIDSDTDDDIEMSMIEKKLAGSGGPGKTSLILMPEMPLIKSEVVSDVDMEVPTIHRLQDTRLIVDEGSPAKRTRKSTALPELKS